MMEQMILICLGKSLGPLRQHQRSHKVLPHLCYPPEKLSQITTFIGLVIFSVPKTKAPKVQLRTDMTGSSILAQLILIDILNCASLITNDSSCLVERLNKILSLNRQKCHKRTQQFETTFLGDTHKHEQYPRQLNHQLSSPWNNW